MVGQSDNSSQTTWAAIITPCDLWVLPTPRDSRWFTRMDWYLNWQMCKGLAYGGLHLPEEIHGVAQEYGVPVLTHQEKPNAPLLVAPSGRLPAARCAVIDRTSDTKTWLRSIHDMAVALKANSLRIFLPKDCDPAEAQNMWPGSTENVFFTADLETTT